MAAGLAGLPAFHDYMGQRKETVISRMYRKDSLEKTISSFLFVIAVVIGLLSVKTVKTERAEENKASELKTSALLSRDDVLSAADALQWRQEFVWHRGTPKICPNVWIDDTPCRRMAKRF